MRRAIFPSALAILVFRAGALQTDDIILHSGQVIEGKVDETATATANAVIKEDAKKVVVYRDQSGSAQMIPRSEIRHIVRCKPSWEVRAEAEAWYAKNRSRYKDTFKDQDALARKCRSKKLAREAELHFRRAYELRSAEIRNAPPSPENHIGLANWCRKAGLRLEEKEQYRIALRIRREQLASNPTAESYQALADWCRKVDLMDEAIELCEEFLKKDPSHSGVKQTLAKIRNTAEFQYRELVQEYARDNRGWVLSVAIEDNVDARFLAEWKTKIEGLSLFIFEVTEGQFFLSEVTIEDQTSNGKILVEKGKTQWKSIGGKDAAGVLAYCVGAGDPGWVVHAPGKTWEMVLCHEIFHGVFGLLDEYYQTPQCHCIMRAAPAPQRICDATTHVGGGHQKEPCWDTIRKRFAKARTPNPDWKILRREVMGGGETEAEQVDGELQWKGLKLSKPPPTLITIIDN